MAELGINKKLAQDAAMKQAADKQELALINESKGGKVFKDGSRVPMEGEIRMGGTMHFDGPLEKQKTEIIDTLS